MLVVSRLLPAGNRLDTTNLYAQANLAAKRAALERLELPASRAPRWKGERGILEWLDSR
jgi:integrase/recombinase XerC